MGGEGASDGPVNKVGEGLTRGGTGGPCVKRTGVVGEAVTVGALEDTTANEGGSSPFNCKLSALSIDLSSISKYLLPLRTSPRLNNGVMPVSSYLFRDECHDFTG